MLTRCWVAHPCATPWTIVGTGGFAVGGSPYAEDVAGLVPPRDVGGDVSRWAEDGAGGGRPLAPDTVVQGASSRQWRIQRIRRGLT